MSGANSEKKVNDYSLGMFQGFYITVPKEYRIAEFLYTKKAVFLFAQLADMHYFQERNSHASCCLVSQLKGNERIILNNKIAYYQYVFFNIPASCKIYFYSFEEIDRLNSHTVLHQISQQDSIFLPNEVNSLLYHFLLDPTKTYFYFAQRQNEVSLQPFSFTPTNQKRKKTDGIVLVPSGGYLSGIDFSLQRLAYFLKSLDKKVVLVALSQDGLDINDCFDEVYLESDILNFLRRIDGIDSEAIIYRGWMHHYMMGGFLSHYFPKVIVNIKDWNFGTKEEYAFFFGKDADEDFLGIEIIFKQAHLILSHYTQEESDKWAEEYGVEKNKFIFFPEFCNDLTQDIPTSRHENSLVWAGTYPPTSFHERHFSSKDLYWSMKECTLKGIKVDFVVPPQFYDGIMRRENKLYDDYLYENQLNENFTMVRGEVLSPKVISRYGYGIFPLFLNDSRCARLFEYSVPSKLAFYLEANLPIIVNAKMKAVAQIVRENNLGIVIANNELSKLTEIINKHQKNYDAMCSNVKKFKQQFSYDTLGKKIWLKHLN